MSESEQDLYLRYMKQMEEDLAVEKLKSTQYQKEYGQVSMFSNENQSNLIREQLSLDLELERIDNLLRGRYISHDDKGNEIWRDPEWPEERVLTEYGVKSIMNIINFLVTKNILLSNFESEDINWKMQDFIEVLIDDMYGTYEFIFYKPTIADIIESDMRKIAIIENKMNTVIPSNLGSLQESLKKRFDSYYLNEIMNIKNKTYSDYEAEVNNIYEKNLTRWPLIVELIVHVIHATYNRALGGIERSSLRTHMHISQNMNPSPNKNIPQTISKQQRNFSYIKPWTWGNV